jgi:hypothetical protein
LLSYRHPELELAEHAIMVRALPSREHLLSGAGLLLVPYMFAWTQVMADVDSGTRRASPTPGAA